MKNRIENLTTDDLPALRIPDGPEAQDWLAMMGRFIAWRENQKTRAHRKVNLRGSPRTGYDIHFFRWWFRTLRWRGKVLDIGCGAGHADGPLLTKSLVSEYRGVDPLLIEDVPRGKWQFYKGVGEVMPFVPDGWAHIVCAFSVLQHCLNPEQLVKEVARCMCRGAANGPAQFMGTVCVRATPHRSDLISADFPDGSVVAGILTGAGFEIVRQFTFEQGLYCFEAVLA